MYETKQRNVKIKRIECNAFGLNSSFIVNRLMKNIDKS